jgi:hypothetical protein
VRSTVFGRQCVRCAVHPHSRESAHMIYWSTHVRSAMQRGSRLHDGHSCSSWTTILGGQLKTVMDGPGKAGNSSGPAETSKSRRCANPSARSFASAEGSRRASQVCPRLPSVAPGPRRGLTSRRAAVPGFAFHRDHRSIIASVSKTVIVLSVRARSARVPETQHKGRTASNVIAVARVARRRPS